MHLNFEPDWFIDSNDWITWKYKPLLFELRNVILLNKKKYVKYAIF